MSEKDIEYMIYSRLCANCPNAIYCNEECETCEQFDEELELAIQESKVNQ